VSLVRIRQFHYPQDYAAALRLWEDSGTGVGVGPSDSPEELERKLARDPDLFLVAEAGDQLRGTVRGGFDGRRGMVYHLAVSQPFRRKGIGSRLMAELEDRLRGKGCLRCYLLVRADNLDAVKYYEAVGWRSLDDHILGKDLR
jgi:ribosomal protein S18 acetylase RimI-like enzyme